jgi:hypothetical protein
VYSNGATALHWGHSGEADLWVYRLYRGTSADFVPGVANLVVARSDTGFVHAGPAGGYYKLSAVDWNGNESPFALVTPGQTAGASGADPLTFALEVVRPNPVSADRMVAAFVLAEPGVARLELLDVAGRRVLAREVGSLGVGRHTVQFGSETRLAPGLYLVRLSAGARSFVRRVVVLD